MIARHSFALAALVLVSAPVTPAQRGAAALRATTIVDPLGPSLRGRGVGSPRALQMQAGVRPAIMLTGYWPPSNEAVRRFSDDPLQNPLGWLGSDWEGRGFDVYAYFPEFSPPTCTSCGKGTGDFEVDYQDTSADFWPLVNALQPIAIITLSRTNPPFSWEVEMNQYNRQTWTNDYVSPVQPTPTPPDASVASGHLRLTALPAQQIVDDIAAANLGLDPFICFSQSAGGFLSGFMAYHGVWYQALHDQPSDPAWCITAGHIHVGRDIAWPTAQAAIEVTLRTVIAHMNEILTNGPTWPSFCFGDGGDQLGCTNCPCANNAPLGQGGGCLNSSPSSGGARLVGSGFPDVSGMAESVRFVVREANPATFGILVSGADRLPTNPANACSLQNPGSGVLAPGVLDGLRCVGGAVLRHGSRASDANGDIGITNAGWGPPDGPAGGIAASSGFVIGQTRHFQCFYREAIAAQCMTGQNTSQGVSITFY